MQPDLSFGVVRNGIDVFIEDGFSTLRHQRIGLVTNHTGLTIDGRRTIDVLAANPDLHLDKIFAPEHGVAGSYDERFGDEQDEATGLPVFSLHGDVQKPTEEHLHGIDVMLYDVQDIGCRFYTYISTLGYVLEACAENGVGVYVLDRPNPIDGLNVEGPSSDAECESFVNYHPLPLRHGMTIGELARLFNRERDINANLRVVTMAGWQRAYWHEHTGQPWIDPSPNIRDLTAAALYPGIGLLEGTNVSVGRGTAQPFHVLGAPWIDATRMATALAEFDLGGLKFEAVDFLPDDPRHPYHGERCTGVRFLVGGLQALSPSDLALALIRVLRRDYASHWRCERLDGLLARPDLMDAIEDDADELDDLWQPDPEFFEARAKALLY